MKKDNLDNQLKDFMIAGKTEKEAVEQ